MNFSGFGLGWKTLRAFIDAADTVIWYKAKMIPELFKPGEVECFEWLRGFVAKHKSLPKLETAVANFPELGNYTVAEPPSYYLEHLENRYYTSLLSAANVESQSILKEKPGAITEAMAVQKDVIRKIDALKFRARVVDFSKEAPQMVLTAYHGLMTMENVGQFGWPYMDKMTGGLMPGDVVTFIGRPAAGKTWKVLYTALHNWQKGLKVMVVSMEMSPLAIVQRLAAMYAHTTVGQLKLGAFSSHTLKKFTDSMVSLAQKDSGLYVVDGNLAASVEEVYALAHQLGVAIVEVDGAYLLRHPNPRLDRYTRVAENAELIKRYTGEAGVPTLASYQFSRTAVKDKKKASGETPGLEDIAYSDVIGQVSSIALGLFQDDSVETINGREIRVLKGRNGEVGSFKIRWDFQTMDFSEFSGEEEADNVPLSFI